MNTNEAAYFLAAYLVAAKHLNRGESLKATSTRVLNHLKVPPVKQQKCFDRAYARYWAMLNRSKDTPRFRTLRKWTEDYAQEILGLIPPD